MQPVPFRSAAATRSPRRRGWRSLHRQGRRTTPAHEEIRGARRGRSAPRGGRRTRGIANPSPIPTNCWATRRGSPSRATTVPTAKPAIRIEVPNRVASHAQVNSASKEIRRSRPQPRSPERLLSRCTRDRPIASLASTSNAAPASTTNAPPRDHAEQSTGGEHQRQGQHRRHVGNRDPGRGDQRQGGRLDRGPGAPEGRPRPSSLPGRLRGSPVGRRPTTRASRNAATTASAPTVTATAVPATSDEIEDADRERGDGCRPRTSAARTRWWPARSAMGRWGRPNSIRSNR